jgi:hypothetical protein
LAFYFQNGLANGRDWQTQKLNNKPNGKGHFWVTS